MSVPRLDPELADHLLVEFATQVSRAMEFLEHMRPDERSRVT